MKYSLFYLFSRLASVGILSAPDVLWLDYVIASIIFVTIFYCAATFMWRNKASYKRCINILFEVHAACTRMPMSLKWALFICKPN